MPTKVRKQVVSKPKSNGRTSKKKKRALTGLAARLETAEFDHGINMNLYGQSGTGKTTFWASFPKPICAVICSGGTKSGELRSLPKKVREQIKQFKIKSSKDFELLTKEQLEDAGNQQFGEPFKTVVLDHATGLRYLILREVLGLEELPEQLGWGIASQQDWGQVAIQVKERFRQLLELEQNTIIVAQERSFEPPEESELEIIPYVCSDLGDSILNWLQPEVDYICQTFKRNKKITKTEEVAGEKLEREVLTKDVEYGLRVGPHGIYTTKFRSPDRDLPDAIINPTFEDFYKYVDR